MYFIGNGLDCLNVAKLELCLEGDIERVVHVQYLILVVCRRMTWYYIGKPGRGSTLLTALTYNILRDLKKNDLYQI